MGGATLAGQGPPRVSHCLASRLTLTGGGSRRPGWSPLWRKVSRGCCWRPNSVRFAMCRKERGTSHCPFPGARSLCSSTSKPAAPDMRPNSATADRSRDVSPGSVGQSRSRDQAVQAPRRRRLAAPSHRVLFHGDEHADDGSLTTRHALFEHRPFVRPADFQAEPLGLPTQRSAQQRLLQLRRLLCSGPSTFCFRAQAAPSWCAAHPC